jgi:SPASM domain peptide maturase of grasp-with-spasm system
VSKVYFNLFANCIPVKGAKNFIICDLHLNRYRSVPEFVYFIFTEFKDKSIKEIKSHFNGKIDKEIDDLLMHLSADDWGFFTNEKKAFPEIDLEYSTPNLFDNAIFDYDGSSTYNLLEAILKVDSVGCQAIQIRFFSEITLKFLRNLVESLNTVNIYYIEIFLRKELDFKISNLRDLFKVNSRLKKIFLHNQTKSSLLKSTNKIGDFGQIYTFKTDFIDETMCGQIRKENFVSDLVFFAESKKFNNCLNKKISIDKDGNIKNCPSMKNHFGKISETSVESITKNRKYKALWKINKDKVDICKDCEFRYICTDCRAYRSNPDNILSKPLKCAYDPYTGEWMKK